MENNVLFNFRLPSAVAERLDFVASVNCCNRSECLRLLINSAYDQLNGNPAITEAVEKLNEVRLSLGVLSSRK